MKLNQKQKLQILKNVAIELPIEILHFIVVPIALLACDEKAKIYLNGRRGLTKTTTA